MKLSCLRFTNTSYLTRFVLTQQIHLTLSQTPLSVYEEYHNNRLDLYLEFRNNPYTVQTMIGFSILV